MAGDVPENEDDSPSDRVEIGHFGRAHGIKGEIRLFSHDPQAQYLVEGAVVWVEGRDAPRALTVEQWRPTPKEFGILKVREIDDRTEAERLANRSVSIAAEALPDLEDDEFYQYELQGAAVYLTERDPDEGQTRRAVGTVGGFFATGANDVMVVVTEDDREVYVPMIEGAIAELQPRDEESGRVVLHPLEDWAADDTEF